MIKRTVRAAGLWLALAIAGTLAGAAWAQPKDSPWGSDYFPNVPLVTQDGKTVRFYDDLLKGKKVLIDFVYANCEQGCPMDTANMARVQKLLGSSVGKDIFMYSITLDPENDTPKVLKEYAEQYRAGPGWLFLTGKREDIDAVRFKLGERGQKEEHANAVKVGDVARGQWVRVPLAADPNYIVTEVRNMFNPGWSAGMALKSIADAPQQEVFGPGQLLFASRCAGCHGFTGKGNDLGPDLRGVTERRERNWLIRFLAEPNKMRAEKDPIALHLAENYKVLMPNLSLTKKELGELFDYLDAQRYPAPDPEPQPAKAAAGGEKPSKVAHDHHDHDHHHHHAADKQ
ncbi:MAG TPA: SCO family protein [Ramlibacter sp.]|nr:SCO family protein [Ramlibacter sp.]